MTSRALKFFMLLLSLILLTSAFMELGPTHAPRSLVLLGGGLVSLAGLSRRHFANEE
jgi:hypothetical protein